MSFGLEVTYKGQAKYHNVTCGVEIQKITNSENDVNIYVFVNPPEVSNVCVLRQPLPIEGEKNGLSYSFRFLKPMGMSSPLTKHTLVFSNDAELNGFIVATSV